ncbi:uncharacterized protein V6R79_019265 [Siganus canaliculatus]
MVCFFPEGFDTDEEDIFLMKVRAMQGCVLSIFEQEKKQSNLNQEGLSKLLNVLNFIRIMMQAFQQHERHCWRIYNGSLHIYTICRYLMNHNCSSQALEYLLWASISLEFVVPLMPSKCLPWIITLYCAVCHCFYDIQASAQAEEFARRAIGKISELAKMQEQSGVPATRETQRAYKEASIKLAAMIFKRTVFGVPRKTKPLIKNKPKHSLKDIPSAPWPRTATERTLMSMFEGGAAQFLGILETLWDSTTRPLQMNLPDPPEQQEVVIELLSAGISILSGATSEHLNAITPTSTLSDLAITGENKVSVISAMRFVRLLFNYKQFDAFAELATEMLQVLPGLEGPSFRKAQLELTLIDHFNTLMSFHRSQDRKDDMTDGCYTGRKLSMNGEFIRLANTLHKSVCGSPPDEQPDSELVLDILLFLWGEAKVVTQTNQHKNPKLTQKCSSTELFQKVCEVVEKATEAISKSIAALLPQCSLAVTDPAFIQKFCPVPKLASSISSPKLLPEEEKEKVEASQKDRQEVDNMEGSNAKGSEQSQFTHASLLVIDLHLQLVIIHHRASLKLLQLNAVTESLLLDRINKNKLYKAVFLIQKAQLVYDSIKPSDHIKNLLEEASTLIEKAGVEERKIYISSKTPENKDKRMKEEEENPPPAPILISRTNRTFTFVPAPYSLEGQVCWYQLCGHAVEGINQKVRLGDCSLPGTGNMVPAVPECALIVEGLEPNQKYVFAVAAYDSQCRLLGNSIGVTTLPLLASMPVSFLSTWAHLAQVAFQTEQHAIAKRACRELWSHFTHPDPEPQSSQLSTTRLHIQTLEHSSSLQCQMFLTSIFIETQINIQQGSLYCDPFNVSGPFIWEQEARLTECERMLVAMDLALWLNDGSVAIQAVVSCYGLLAPMIFHQITCDPVVQVLKKCLIVLEENSDLIQKWSSNTAESLMHMIACITYHLTKALRVLREHHMASAVIDCGRKLLQDVYDSQLQSSRVAHVTSKRIHTAVKGENKIKLQMKALHLQNKKSIPSEAALSAGSDGICNGCEDPATWEGLVSTSTLQDTYHHVMKLRHKPCFTEYSSRLLQRSMQEGYPDLVLEWGQSIFEFLSVRDKVMKQSKKSMDVKGDRKRRKSVPVSKGNGPSQNKNAPDQSDVRKNLGQKLPHSMLRRVKTHREMQIVENLLTKMSAVMQRQKKQLWLRNMWSEERVWRSHLNYRVAQAYLALLYQSLEQLGGGSMHHRYSQLNPLCFSLAYSGVLVQKNSQWQLSKCEGTLERDSSHLGRTDSMTAHHYRNKKEAFRVDDSVSEKSEEGPETVEQQTKTHQCTADLLLDYLQKAALHLQRAMVLAHRGGHWAFLRYLCHTVWDQNSRITFLAQEAAQLEAPFPLTADALHTTFTPLLVLATDLTMDMLNRLGLWNLYGSDSTEEELESNFHFSGPLDDSTLVDLRWTRNLVLHTLECLHESRKWESLAHFALVFNSYTRERYAMTICPLLVHAQRKLLERIRSFGGPAVPQPHHVKTQKATGKEVTYRNYAGCQLLSGWTSNTAQHPATYKKAAGRNRAQYAADLKVAEIQRSMSLVCVPLSVDDTLSCFRQAFENTPYCLQVLQHSRSLLLLLLAYTQPCFTGQLQDCQSRSRSHSASVVDFSTIVNPIPNIEPCDLTEEDYSALSALYSLPISPDHLPTITAAYSTSIKYLQASGHNSLRVLAFHEMGNLQFCNGNARAAHSCWSKAIDCALQSSGTIEKWNGITFGGDSLQQTLKQAGIWGCLQAAGLSAKIAQYILASDVSQRTKCCLLSAHLFKCVLCCSLAQPQADLQYAYHSIGDELLPGVDLFSEPKRVHLGTTVTSLYFVCHWLFTTGYYNTLLPILALYLHFVGTVCRDVQRTVDGKILKIRVLTQLCLFTEAVKESVMLTQGCGVLLPFGHYPTKNNEPVKTFYCDKSLLDNTEALEELVNCDFTPEICSLYGSMSCIRFYLARIQLILALSRTIHGSPVPDSVEREAWASVTGSSVNLKHHEQVRQGTTTSSLNTKEQKVVTFQTENVELTLDRFKFLLLDAAFSLMDFTLHQLSNLSCSKAENLELMIESNLLKANLYLQQGHAELSSEMAVSVLVLLQTSTHDCQKPECDPQHTRTESEPESELCRVFKPLSGDLPKAVEASERICMSMWVRGRLALVQSLTANIPGNAARFPGKNMNDEAIEVLQEGLYECGRWGDLDNQALLMVEGAELEANRGKTDDSIAMLQKAVGMLSGRTCMPLGSSVTLARATLLLSDLQGFPNVTLLRLTQKLLKNQLGIFGQHVLFNDGKFVVCPLEPSNNFLPYLSFLNQVTMKLENK